MAAVAMRVIDLSFTIRPHLPLAGLRASSARADDSGALFQSSVLDRELSRVHARRRAVHFLPGDRDITAMPIDQWMGPAAVVDLTHLGDNGEVTAEDLERRAGHVEAGDIVLLRTDWPRRTPTSRASASGAMRRGPAGPRATGSWIGA